MQAYTKAAGWAALGLTAAMIMHIINGMWLEPTYLGFKDYTDYGKMDKIFNALGSFSFTSSGIAHAVSGFLTPIVGLGIYMLFKDERPVAAHIAFVSAIISGLGYLLTGISDLTGANYSRLLIELNPEGKTAMLLASTYLRSMAVTLAVVAMGWLAFQTSLCILRSGKLSKGVGYFGLLATLVGIGMFMVFMPYFIVFPIWALWLGTTLLRYTSLEDGQSGLTLS